MESDVSKFPPLRAAFIAVLSLLILGACASNSKKKTLDFTLNQYEVAVRWSQWDGTLDFLAPEYLEEHPVSALDLDRLRLFRVTQYVVRSVMPSSDGLAVQQVVELRLFNRNRAIEKSLIDRQEWRYNEERQRWFLHSGLPDVTRSR